MCESLYVVGGLCGLCVRVAVTCVSCVQTCEWDVLIIPCEWVACECGSCPSRVRVWGVLCVVCVCGVMCVGRVECGVCVYESRASVGCVECVVCVRVMCVGCVEFGVCVSHVCGLC